MLAYEQVLKKVLIGAIPILLVLSCIVLSRISGGAAVSESSKIRAVLARYESRGLFRPPIFDQHPEFTWTRRSFTFRVGAGKDLDEFVKGIDAQRAAQAGDGPEFLKLSFVEFAAQVGLLFAKGTAFEGKFQTNAAPKADFINLYIIDDDPEGLTKHFRNNCEYIGYYNTIICHSALFKTYFSFIDRLQTTYDIVNVDLKTRRQVPIEGQALEDVKNLMKQSIVVWVLGHEIGHAALHKNVLLRENKRLHFDLEYNALEQEADGFVASGLGASPLATSFFLATGEFVHQEFRRIYLQRAHDEKVAVSIVNSRYFVLENKVVVPYNKYKYDVPMLLRAVRILNRLADIAPEIDGTGFFKVVADNMTLVTLSPDRFVFWLLFWIACLLGCVVVACFIWAEKRQRDSLNVDHR